VTIENATDDPSTRDDDGLVRKSGGQRDELVLVVVWCPLEPARLGEILVLPRGGEPVLFGRGAREDDDVGDRIAFRRERPGQLVHAGQLRNPFISRTQLELRAVEGGVAARNLGKRAIEIEGVEEAEGTVPIGRTLLVKGQLLLLCARRKRPMLEARAAVAAHPFGEADAVGIVGESPAAWALREQIAFVGPRGPHVLLLGESGTGKELVAQALHASSPRARRKVVARNAATLPAGLIDAELFGNVANYPNPGMPERAGIVGEADGSTLFLDEIGELPDELQAHLLRFLDERGEYQRLGDARRRTADVRVIAATNRPITDLKHDLAARLQLRVHVPSLNDRIEDVPLLVRHLLQKIAAHDPALGERFFAGWDGRRGEPRVSSRLMRALLAHRYTTHVRELEAILWCALSTSAGVEIDLTSEAGAMIAPAASPAAAARREADADEIRAAMARHGGVQEKVWRDLGLPNRHVLQRLLKKHGIRGDADG